MNVQLPLALRLRDASSFDNFIDTGNAELVLQLRAAAAGEARGQQIYLWSPSACGKSHLLEACCRDAAGHARRPAYVPLAGAGGLTPEVLDGLETVDLVCLDDVDAVAGDTRWESALFRLYDRLRDAGCVLIAAGRRPPAVAGFAMPELSSRIARGLTYRVAELDDAGRGEAVRRRAGARGIELGDEVLGYVLRRCARDLHALFALLERIDRASLAAKRRVTVPLVRELLNEE